MGWIWWPSLQGDCCLVSVSSLFLSSLHHWLCIPTPEPLWSCYDPPPQQWGHQVSWWRRMRHLMYKNYILFNIHCPTITIILPYSNCIACRLLLWKCSSRRVTTPHRWNWHNSIQLTVLHQFNNAIIINLEAELKNIPNTVYNEGCSALTLTYRRLVIEQAWNKDDWTYIQARRSA